MNVPADPRRAHTTGIVVGLAGVVVVTWLIHLSRGPGRGAVDGRPATSSWCWWSAASTARWPASRPAWSRRSAFNWFFVPPTHTLTVARHPQLGLAGGVRGHRHHHQLPRRRLPPPAARERGAPARRRAARPTWPRRRWPRSGPGTPGRRWRPPRRAPWGSPAAASTWRRRRSPAAHNADGPPAPLAPRASPCPWSPEAAPWGCWRSARRRPARSRAGRPRASRSRSAASRPSPSSAAASWRPPSRPRACAAATS